MKKGFSRPVCCTTRAGARAPTQGQPYQPDRHTVYIDFNQLDKIRVCRQFAQQSIIHPLFNRSIIPSLKRRSFKRSWIVKLI